MGKIRMQQVPSTSRALRVEDGAHRRRILSFGGSKPRRFYRAYAGGEEASWPQWALELDAAKELFEGQAHVFVDMRTVKEFDYEHLTKPVKMTVNIPFESMDEFTAQVKARYRPTAKLLLVDGSGDEGLRAAGLLREAGYEAAYGVIGGYDGWLKRYTTTGRRRIAGKFVSSGKEALKSGLNLDAAVASTYEENHGRADLSLPSNRVKCEE